MIQAHNLDEFIDANSALQMPFFNVIYADRRGHILYLFGGQQPVRQGGDWGKYSGVLDGSDPSLVWTNTFTSSELPRAIDPPGGFVANSNNPPWTSSFPFTRTNDPAHFPAYVSPQFMDLRPQNGAGFLLSGKSLTRAQILAGKELTHMLLADRVLPDLINAANLSGNPIAQQAAATLTAWDRNADPQSKGAVLFEAWWAAASTDANVVKDNTINFYSPHPAFRVGWSASDPLNTPNGLANAAALVPDLIAAASFVVSTWVLSMSHGATFIEWYSPPMTQLSSKPFLSLTTRRAVPTIRSARCVSSFGFRHLTGSTSGLTAVTTMCSSSNSQKKAQKRTLCLAMGMRRGLVRPT